MLSPKVHNFDGFLELYEANAGLLSATEIASKIAAIKTATSLGDAEIKNCVANLAAGKNRSSLSSNDVKVLQVLVGTNPDGKYGPGTQTKVREFQANVLGLNPNDPVPAKRPDGMWGKNTGAKFSEVFKPVLDTFGIKPGEPSGSTSNTPSSPSENPEVCFYVNKIIDCLGGAFEREDVIISTIESIEPKGAEFLKQIEILFNSLGLEKQDLQRGTFGIGGNWRNLENKIRQGLESPQKAKQSIEAIMAEKKKSTSNKPITLRDFIGYYFNDGERRELNGVLPGGFDKFQKVDKI